MKEENVNSRMYFMAVVLPDNLDVKIRAYKKLMQERYGCKVGLKSPAHITLVPPFWMPEEKEEDLKKEMIELALDIAAFSIATSDFSAFRPRTIFVAVKESDQLKLLKKATDSRLGQNNFGIKTENRPFHPHITIATRDLHKKDFAASWPLFENEHFREDFEVSSLSLLKHNGKTWDVVFEAPLSKP
jgi:2'-5' RNA ligase